MTLLFCTFCSYALKLINHRLKEPVATGCSFKTRLLHLSFFSKGFFLQKLRSLKTCLTENVGREKGMTCSKGPRAGTLTCATELRNFSLGKASALLSELQSPCIYNLVWCVVAYKHYWMHNYSGTKAGVAGHETVYKLVNNYLINSFNKQYLGLLIHFWWLDIKK